ncbi:hypothetical protein MRX96_029492 [Rhipicephalus microplus]
MATQAAVRNVGRLSSPKDGDIPLRHAGEVQEDHTVLPADRGGLSAAAESRARARHDCHRHRTVWVTQFLELGLAEFPDIKPIEKTQFSMMTDEVTKTMQEKGLDSVVLCGIETHVCVQNTALALLERGFNVHIAVDACSSRTMVDRRGWPTGRVFFCSSPDSLGFERMKASGAWLTTSESVILSLLGGSSHPKFKEVQKLIMESAPDSGLLGFAQKHTSAL